MKERPVHFVEEQSQREHQEEAARGQDDKLDTTALKVSIRIVHVGFPWVPWAAGLVLLTTPQRIHPL